MIEAARKMELNQMQRDNLQKVEEAFAELMKTVRPSTDRWRYRYLRRRVKTAVASVLEPEQIAQLEAAIEQRRAEHIKQGKNLEEFGDNDDEMTPPGEESPDGGGR
jgi:hypothetical protein